MTKHHLDIVPLQGIHVNYTGKEEHGDFLFYFSSIIEDDHRRKTDLKLEEMNQKVKTKRITAQEAKRERLDILNISAEKLGVGFVYRKSSFKGTEMDVTCIKKRIISLTINTVPLGISLTNVYAPHAGLTSQTKTDGFLWLPSPFSKTTSTKSNQFDIGWFRRKINGNTPWRKNDSWPVYLSWPWKRNLESFEWTTWESKNVHWPLFRRNIYRQYTWFCKPTARLATYRNPTVPTFN